MIGNISIGEEEGKVVVELLGPVGEVALHADSESHDEEKLIELGYDANAAIRLTKVQAKFLAHSILATVAIIEAQEEEDMQVGTSSTLN